MRETDANSSSFERVSRQAPSRHAKWKPPERAATQISRFGVWRLTMILLPSAHVALALRTGATLLPAFAHRDGDTLRAVFGPELELPRTGDRDADVHEGVRRWAGVLEPHVAVAPEQWSVFEAVWRR